MSKRFIKQVIPLKVWRKLGSSLREAWNYMWMNCDEAGVYVIDEDLYEFNIGEEFPLESIKVKLNDWLLFSGEKILILAFIEVNYGNKLKPSYNPHKPLFRAIAKHKLKLDSSLNQACFKLVDEEEDVYEEEEEEEEEVIKTEIPKTKKTHQSKPIEIPTITAFVEYAQENAPDVSVYAVELKYKAWLQNGWKTGGKTPRTIKNWKTTLLNTLPHLLEFKNGKQDSNNTEPRVNRQSANTIYQNSQGWEVD